MPDRDAEKRLAAHHAAGLVQSGMRVGLGSGTTAAHVVRALAERIQTEGLKIEAVTTSLETLALAKELGIPLLETAHFDLDIALDGADQVTRTGDAIKGAGGALFHERIVAAAAKRFVIVVDSSKLVEKLDGVPVPVEVVGFGWKNAVVRLQALGAKSVLRGCEARPFATEEGNIILDCSFPSIPDPAALERSIRTIPGVVDCGLFLGMANTVLVGRGDEVEVIEVG